MGVNQPAWSPDAAVAVAKLEELRERIKMRRLCQLDPEQRHRSPAFYAALQKIKAGESRETVWQLLRRERQWRRERARRLDQALGGVAAAAEVAVPEPVEEEIPYPPGSWVC